MHYMLKQNEINRFLAMSSSSFSSSSFTLNFFFAPKNQLCGPSIGKQTCWFLNLKAVLRHEVSSVQSWIKLVKAYGFKNWKYTILQITRLVIIKTNLSHSCKFRFK